MIRRGECMVEAINESGIMGMIDVADLSEESFRAMAMEALRRRNQRVPVTSLPAEQLGEVFVLHHRHAPRGAVEAMIDSFGRPADAPAEEANGGDEGGEDDRAPNGGEEANGGGEAEASGKEEEGSGGAEGEAAKEEAAQEEDAKAAQVAEGESAMAGEAGSEESP